MARIGSYRSCDIKGHQRETSPVSPCRRSAILKQYTDVHLMIRVKDRLKQEYRAAAKSLDTRIAALQDELTHMQGSLEVRP
jgi:hypothetical protein